MIDENQPLVDLVMCLHGETEKAIQVSDDGDKTKAVWLPKSHVEFTPAPLECETTVTMPEWLAQTRGLI